MVTRVYTAINANTAATPSEQQWKKLVSTTKEKPVSTAILVAAQGLGNEKFITASKRSYGTELLRWTLAGFEIKDSKIVDVRVVVNSQAEVYGLESVTPLSERFIRVLEKELQESATKLGYGSQASLLTIPWYTFGDRGSAIDSVQEYLAVNDEIWHDPNEIV